MDAHPIKYILIFPSNKTHNPIIKNPRPQIRRLNGFVLASARWGFWELSNFVFVIFEVFF